ncbi:universal stress protein [Cyclobacterium sp. SYSU L10401]|uniref:universal stress protein n=1 Tax=Cyclobacterium sp. SYSU L10401 TaxID=2678657 RepID=UPI0013D0B7E4|nr:universal stress protein [Cyclobacterium sp. SYSU L10401]
MKKILYATDFSENAEKAFIQALKIAQKHKANLIMLHVFDIPTSWNYPYTEDALEMERQAICESENKLKGIFDQYAKDINIKYIAAESTSIVKAIISVIRENDPGLVVIGTKGGSKVKEVIVGSTTKELINKSPVPVLAVPENAVDSDLKKILYATDLHEADIPALKKLTALVRPFDSEITVTHVSTPNEYKGAEKMEWFKDLVKDRINYDGITIQLLLVDNIYEELNAYINQQGFNLLVMLEKERKGIVDRLFHSDLVKKMEFHTSIPLLSFNEHYLRVLEKK